MARGIGFGRAGKRARKSGWVVVCSVQLLWLVVPSSALRAAALPCTSVELTSEGLVAEPCEQAVDSGTVPLDTPHFPVNSDAINIALGGATKVFGVGLTALQNNPAGMAQVSQYAFSFGYGYFGQPDNYAFTAAATDSLTNPHMAGGIMYSYHRIGAEIDGRETHGSAQRIRMGLTLSERWQNVSLHLGGAAQLDKETIGSIDRNLWNFDVGALVVGFQMLWLGGVIQRVMDQSDDGRPSSAGGGIGFARGPVQVEYDFSARTGDGEEKLVSHSVGLQVAPYVQLPVRLGYRNQPAMGFESISGGVGYISLQGAFDVSYAQELGGANRKWVMAQFRLFLGP